MQTLRLTAEPDQDLWFQIPSRYPDQRGDSPWQWARAVLAEHLAAAADPDVQAEVAAQAAQQPPLDPARLEQMLGDLAESEQGRQDGTAYLYLPPEGGLMQKVRLRAVVTEELGASGALSPLDPAQDQVDAEYLGLGVRSIVAGVAHEKSRDLMVTVAYRWDLGWVSILLTMATLDPGQAVAMLPALDDFADDIWVEDENDEIIMVVPIDE